MADTPAYTWHLRGCGCTGPAKWGQETLVFDGAGEDRCNGNKVAQSQGRHTNHEGPGNPQLQSVHRRQPVLLPNPLTSNGILVSKSLKNIHNIGSRFFFFFLNRSKIYLTQKFTIWPTWVVQPTDFKYMHLTQLSPVSIPNKLYIPSVIILHFFLLHGPWWPLFYLLSVRTNSPILSVSHKGNRK